MIEYLTTNNKNAEFNVFLKQLEETGCSYEMVVENGKIIKLYVRTPSDGVWKGLEYGRIFGSKMVSYIQTVYLPRLVDGKFIYNFNEKNERFK